LRKLDFVKLSGPSVKLVTDDGEPAFSRIWLQAFSLYIIFYKKNTIPQKDLFSHNTKNKGSLLSAPSASHLEIHSFTPWATTFVPRLPRTYFPLIKQKLSASHPAGHFVRFKRGGEINFPFECIIIINTALKICVWRSAAVLLFLYKNKVLIVCLAGIYL